MSAYAVHHDYKDELEMQHSALDLYYLVYRLGTPEALVQSNGHVRFMIGQINDKDIIFLRVPFTVYDMHVAFETFPIRTIEDYWYGRQTRQGSNLECLGPDGPAGHFYCL